MSPYWSLEGLPLEPNIQALIFVVHLKMKERSTGRERKRERREGEGRGEERKGGEERRGRERKRRDV